MADWDEIRRLAADLQRAQLSGAVQRLSERNCVEIVSKLAASGLLDVIYTADGKEYIVPQHLQREIRDELSVSRGRASLVDLAKALNVDFSHVEAQAQAIAKADNRLHLVLGQLVDSTYLDSVCEEINEQLQLHGTVSLVNLTKDYDLPSDFLQEEIGRRLGGVIEGFRDESDPRTLLTPAFVQRNKAKVRGALSAVTVPTSVADIVGKYGIPENLFFTLAEELIRTKRVAGTLTGGKKANKATYNPAAYARAQLQWTDDFMTQNGYVEHEAVARLGVTDAPGFLKRRFGEEKVLHLPNCCVSRDLVSAAESSMDESLAAGSWCDLTTHLPSALSDDDRNKVTQNLVSSIGSGRAAIYAGSVVLARSLVDKVRNTFVDMMNEQAKKDLASKKYDSILSGSGGGGANLDVEDKVDKKEERRRKAATGKGGGGTQGRETKTKSTKKKGGNNRRKGGGGDWSSDDEDDPAPSRGGKGGKAGGGGGKQHAPVAARIEFMSAKDLEEKISAVAQLSDCPEEVFSEMTADMLPELSRYAQMHVTYECFQ